jgi:prepilin-type N-terminal cleavage/methylation domain-containing protein/prepilin-type processing-associated H-X9-DG protein
MKTQTASHLFRTDPGSGRINAFTLVELLVVVVVIAVLAVMVMPALAANRGREQAAICLNNLRQLQLGYNMYPQDNGDYLLPNLKGVGTAAQWVEGEMTWASEANNLSLLENCQLYPYCKSVAIYKCPADTVLNPVSQTPTCRSYAVNTYLDGDNPVDNNENDVTQDIGIIHAGAPPAGTYVVQSKFSSMQSPGPAKRIIFVDESAGSIDDGNYATPPSGLTSTGADLYGPYNMWVNQPTARHGNGAGLSYADGHAIVMSWKGTQLQAWDSAGAIGIELFPVINPADLADLRAVQAGMALPAGEN